MLFNGALVQKETSSTNSDLRVQISLVQIHSYMINITITYTLFYKNIVFQPRLNTDSYFSADFRLKMFL